MPIFRANGKLIYFAHVPKCGGTAVEVYLKDRFGPLAFMDQTYFGLSQDAKWNATSPQHIDQHSLKRLCPSAFFDVVFAVVRHPVERLVSEFHFLRDKLLSIPQTTTFTHWIDTLQMSAAQNSWMHDNHLRPMNAIVPDGATVFRLEDGLDQLVGFFDAISGSTSGPRSLPVALERDSAIQKAIPTLDDIHLIEALYAEDFDRFGYRRQTNGTPHRRSALCPDPAPSVAEAEAALRDGIQHFGTGRFDLAAKAFRVAIDGLGGNPAPRALFANAILRQGEVGMALYHAMVVLRDHPEHTDALVALAGAALRMGDFALLSKTIAQLDRHPALAEFVRLLKIAVATEEGDFEAALFDLADCLEKSPEDPMALELFHLAFRKFKDNPDRARYLDFLTSLGLDFPDGPPLTVAPQDAIVPGSVDIIIPVYNALPDLIRCIGSLRKFPSAAFRRLILVDDCSEAETAAWLRQYAQDHDDVILTRNAENLGFTRTVMAGVAESEAPFAVFLNSDTVVTEGWLDGLLVTMASRPNAALVGPFSNDGFYQTIQPGAAPDAAKPFSRLLSDADLAANRVREVSRRLSPPIPFLSGFCLLVRRDALDRVGGLDCENFPFGYWEVQDVCLKLMDLGYLPLIADSVYVYHASGGSISDQRRLALARAGKAAICAIHSAIRVYSAIELCANAPEVLWHRKAWGEFETADSAHWQEI